jgi:hypothetical protein
MRTRNLIFVLLALLAVSPLAAQTGSSSEYSILLKSLKAGKTDIDYGRLRLSYMDSPEYKQALDTTDAAKAMLEALNAKDYARALTQAETVLKSNYVNIEAHFVAFVANHESGATDKAEFHRAVFRGLIDSIRSSGDGKSPATAWVVISVDEEYSVLRVLGLKPSGQSLMNQNGHSYDVMKAKSDDGTEQTFYFNVDIPFKHYGF